MLMDRFRLDGKVAIVTGAGRGIGKAIALGLAEAGGSVVCAARTQEEIDSTAAEATKLGGRGVSVRCDVTKEEDLDNLIETTVEELGRIDILVNNAGGSLPTLALYTSREALADAFDFNVTSAFLLSRKTIPVMLRNEQRSQEQSAGEEAASEGPCGVILNISSALSHFVESGFIAYGTSKAALNHMTRLLANELAPKIRANALAVGSVETDALALVLSTDDLRRQMVDMTPMRRIGEPEDVAAAAVYLCSPAASWVTGKVLEVDGGTVASNWPMKIDALENLPE